MSVDELRMLVVEDDKFQRQLVVGMLRSLNVESIIEADDGKQAIDFMRDQQTGRIDMVLCDLQMPRMDGLEFMRHLSAESVRPMVVIASALDDKLLSSADLMAKAYGIRLLGVLRKPYTLNFLKDLLSKYTQGEKKWQPTSGEQTFSLEEILQGLRDDQFEPYFQAKVDFKSGRLVGAEALARWVHPSLGVIAPHAFIPLLEKHHLLDELTFVLLRKSALACRGFHAQGHILTISVNLSLSSLNDATLADKIIQTVKQAGVDPHYIVLEITESAAMTNTGLALENLTRLCMHGFVLSIDDYGTGYSSMQQLTRIAFGELKIDQSFVKDAALNESLRIVVASSIDMAHKLQVKSVAEGVETQQDWDMLKTMGCDTAQGYLIARPVSQVAFYQFMASYKMPTVVKHNPAVIKRNQLKVLVIDDDDFTRNIVVRILSDLQFDDVQQVGSGQAAIKLMETQSFDLILTDVNMPDMTGLELVHLIRSGKTHAKADTRILVLTGYSNTEMLGVALALDVNGFLVKPLIPAVLDEKITQAMMENLKLRPPLAYLSVTTEVHDLPQADTSTKPHIGAATLRNPSETAPRVTRELSQRVHMSRLRPGMVVREDVCAKDGTLLLKSGQVLTELSINRINDLSGFLGDTTFVVEEPK